MSNPILLAVITGLASGAASGWLTSSWHIRRTLTAQAEAGGLAASGRGNVQAAAGGLAASTRRGSISQTVSAERAAQLSATIERSQDPGLPTQVLVLHNVGDRAADELVVGTTPDGGGFYTAPDWRKFPRHLAGGQRAAVTCVTGGSGFATVVVTFTDEGRVQGPSYLQATHE